MHKSTLNAIQQNSEKKLEAIKSLSENAQMTQELSSLQTQLSNLRSEKRSLGLEKKQTRTHNSQLLQIDEEERQIIARINTLESSLYPKQGNSAAVWAPISLGGQKSGVVAFFLALFLGMFGVHRFYTGHTKLGILYLCTAGVGGMGWIIDLLLLSFNAYKDADGMPLTSIGSIGIKTMVVLFVGTFIRGLFVSAADPNAPPAVLLLLAFGIPLILVNIKMIWKVAKPLLQKKEKTVGA
jgi:TM2 domain-containing membrane protein YozV